MFTPLLMSRLFPATMLTFFPEMLTSPFGALMLIPVNAFILMSPNGLFMLIFRSVAESFTSYMPLASLNTIPPLSGFGVMSSMVVTWSRLSFAISKSSFASSHFFFSSGSSFEL